MRTALLAAVTFCSAAALAKPVQHTSIDRILAAKVSEEIAPR
nr:hypothetical protein [Pseudomonas sp. R-28-1W-6]